MKGKAQYKNYWFTTQAFTPTNLNPQPVYQIFKLHKKMAPMRCTSVLTVRKMLSNTALHNRIVIWIPSLPGATSLRCKVVQWCMCTQWGQQHLSSLQSPTAT